MPYDYLGNTWSDEEFNRSRWEGLAGGVSAMAQMVNDPTDWSQTIRSFAAGYHRGMEGSLADVLKQRDVAEKEAEQKKLEEQKLAAEEAKRKANEEAITYYESQMTPDELANGRPRSSYANPEDYVKDLAERSKARESSLSAEEEKKTLADAVRQLRPDIQSPERLPQKTLEKILDQAVKAPEPLSPSEKIAEARWAQEQSDRTAEEEARAQEGTDFSKPAMQAYLALPPETRSQVAPPWRYGTDQKGAYDAYRGVAKGLPKDKYSDDYIAGALGPDDTGDPVKNRQLFDRRQGEEASAKAGGRPIQGQTGATQNLGMVGNSVARPTGALPTNGGAAPKPQTIPNPKSLTKETFSGLLQRAGLDAQTARMLAADPQKMAVVQAEWARARTPDEEAQVIARIKASAQRAGVLGRMRY